MIPPYMLRRLAMPGGIRLPKREEPQDVAGICPTCSKAVIREVLLGCKQVKGQYTRGDFYHYQCVPRYGYSPGGWHVEAKFSIPKGNLGQEEYRYWIGVEEQSMAFAMCRCCRQSVYGNTRDRTLHFADSRYVLDGNQCSVRLTNAYKQMLLNCRECIICKKNRFNHDKWGVPICELPACERAWKFDVGTRWVALETELMLQKKKAEFLARVKSNEKAIVTLGEKMTERAWCMMCSMFVDQKGHEDIHNRRAESQAYCGDC
jgi:hypothetical protein